MSFTPDMTADMAMRSQDIRSAVSRASVVFPTPGGPHRTKECSFFASKASLRGFPGPIKCAWPTTSSKLDGRRSSAKGADGCVEKRSMPRALYQARGTAVVAGWRRVCEFNILPDADEQAFTYRVNRNHLTLNMPTTDSCPDCGNTATVETNVSYAGSYLAEATYHCVGCRRHRAYFAYGAWAEGTRQLPEGAQAETVARAIAQTRTLSPDFQAQQLVILKELTGKPLMMCRKAHTLAEGDFLVAKAHLQSRNVDNFGLLVTYAH